MKVLSQVQSAFAALITTLFFAATMLLSGCGVDTIMGPEEAGPIEQHQTGSSTDLPPPSNDDCEGAGGC